MNAKYKNCEISQTNTATDVYKTVFGKTVKSIGYVYEITGEVNKEARVRPFLTSVKSCKEFINQTIEARGA